jgi:hypothetical protein
LLIAKVYRTTETDASPSLCPIYPMSGAAKGPEGPKGSVSDVHDLTVEPLVSVCRLFGSFLVFVVTEPVKGGDGQVSLFVPSGVAQAESLRVRFVHVLRRDEDCTTLADGKDVRVNLGVEESHRRVLEPVRDSAVRLTRRVDNGVDGVEHLVFLPSV